MRVAVRFHVLLGGFFGVILGLNVVAVRQVGVVSGGFVIAVFMMLGGFMVMARSVLVVLRCLLVVFHCFMVQMPVTTAITSPARFSRAKFSTAFHAKV